MSFQVYTPHRFTIAFNSDLSSAKMALAIDSVLKPLFSPGGKYEGKVKAIIRLQVQPWHGSSTFTHEAALAVRSYLLRAVVYLMMVSQVARVSPEAFWPFSLAVRRVHLVFDGEKWFIHNLDAALQTTRRLL